MNTEVEDSRVRMERATTDPVKSGTKDDFMQGLNEIENK